MTGLRWTLICLFFLAALAVASVTAEPGSWRESVRWAKSWQQQAVSKSSYCPVLVPDSGSGDGARAAYEKVAKLAANVDPEQLSSLRALLRDRTATREQAMQAVAGLPLEVVAALQRAVRTPGPTYSSAALGTQPKSKSFPLFELFRLGDVLLVRSRYDDQEPDRVAAWLDALAFGVDLMGMEFPILETLGFVATSQALEVCDAAWLDALSAASLQRIAEALGAVDEATPVVCCLDSIVAHYVLLMHTTPDLEPGDLGFQSIYSTWEHGFSVERAGISRIGGLRARVEQFVRETPASEPWPRRKARLMELARADKQANEDLFQPYLGSVVERETSRREFVAQLRSLRLSVANRLGKSLVLQDPFGSGPLAVPQARSRRPR